MYLHTCSACAYHSFVNVVSTNKTRAVICMTIDWTKVGRVIRCTGYPFLLISFFNSARCFTAVYSIPRFLTRQADCFHFSCQFNLVCGGGNHSD